MDWTVSVFVRNLKCMALTKWQKHELDQAVASLLGNSISEELHPHLDALRLYLDTWVIPRIRRVVEGREPSQTQYDTTVTANLVVACIRLLKAAGLKPSGSLARDISELAEREELRRAKAEDRTVQEPTAEAIRRRLAGYESEAAVLEGFLERTSEEAVLTRVSLQERLGFVQEQIAMLKPFVSGDP